MEIQKVYVLAIISENNFCKIGSTENPALSRLLKIFTCGYFFISASEVAKRGRSEGARGWGSRDFQ